MSVHSYAKCLDPSDNEEAVPGCKYAADSILEVVESVGERLVVYHYEARDRVGVSAQVLCAAVDYDICAEFDRALQIRREECVVYDNELVVLLADLTYRFNVGDSKKRVRGSLDIDSLNVIIDCRLDCREVGCIYDLISDAEVLEYVVEDTECSAVDVVGDDQLVA